MRAVFWATIGAGACVLALREWVAGNIIAAFWLGAASAAGFMLASVAIAFDGRQR